MQSNRFIFNKKLLNKYLLNCLRSILNSFSLSERIKSKMISLDDTASRMNAIRKKPMIVVCGCTGTGKTKLSIELAQWLISQNRKCEIINADAMQVLN
jgi:polynucleotide 5'-kinase involved in rRNA processing